MNQEFRNISKLRERALNEPVERKTFEKGNEETDLEACQASFSPVFWALPELCQPYQQDRITALHSSFANMDRSR